MYDLIDSLLAHSWDSSLTESQSLIYVICGALIIIFSVTLIDLFYRLIRSVFKKGDF